MCKANVKVVNHSLTLTKGKNESMITPIILTEGQEAYSEDLHGDRQIKANLQPFAGTAIVPDTLHVRKTRLMCKAQKVGSDGCRVTKL